MIKAYFYYPTPNTHISIHTDPECKDIQKHQHGDEQRIIHVNIETFSNALLTFTRREYKFASETYLNDMYLFIDLGNQEFEIAVVNYVKSIIEERYTPFQRVSPEIHNCKI